MATAPILETPPAAWRNELYVIPPDALGPDFKIVYTDGRNNGATLSRKRRTAINGEISHTMGGPGTERPQTFANSEMGADATLAEIATFPAAASPYGKPTLLVSLPLDIIGAGSVAGGATGLTHESAELSGDPNVMPWTPDHIALKAALTAWLIRNPLRWPKLNIRYQLYRNPYAATPAEGGLGFHTMWDTCGVQAGGTNPWTLYCKSCPGWERRGTQRKVQFPNGLITDIQFEAGNARDYYEAVGRLLAPAPPQEDDNDMAEYVQLAGAQAVFQDGAVLMRIPGEDLTPNDAAGKPTFRVRTVPAAYFKRRGLVGPMPGPGNGMDTRQWTTADFAWYSENGLIQGPKGDKGDTGAPGAPGAPGTIPDQANATVYFS